MKYMYLTNYKHRKFCEGCIHYRPVAEHSRYNKVCHYILDTGKARTCPAENCEHYEREKK